MRRAHVARLEASLDRLSAAVERQAAIQAQGVQAIQAIGKVFLQSAQTTGKYQADLMKAIGPACERIATPPVPQDTDAMVERALSQVRAALNPNGGR